MTEHEIILASQSPRRVEILRSHGHNPVIRPADVDESLPEGIGPRDAVMFLSLKKARAVELDYLREKGLPDPASLSFGDAPEEEHTDSARPIILAADTVVYKEKIMGKPKDREEAFRMLAKIRNDVHYVATGVTLIEAGTLRRRTFCEVTKVWCGDYTDREILDYIDREQPYDKAGAYAIQGPFREHIHHIEGYYDNVVGLPYEPVARLLSGWDEEE